MTDRYEPLPGVFGLPRHLVQKLSPAGRRVVAVVGLVLLAGAIVAAVILVPRIGEIRRDNAERARAEAAQARAERLRELRAEQRPHFGRSAASGRAAIVRDVEGAITVDANRRVRSGELNTPVESTSCTLGPLGRGRQPLACTAITSAIPTGEASRGGRVGYPYRALAHLETGRFALCKVSGRPGEGFLGKDVSVALPRECGG